MNEYLADVQPDQKFVLSNGWVVMNLEGLLNAIKSCDDSVFYTHVNSEKNDFANWIKYCTKNEALYSKILVVREKKSFIDMLESEITILKNPRLLETAKYFQENMGATSQNSANIPVSSSVSPHSSTVESSANSPPLETSASVVSSPQSNAPDPVAQVSDSAPVSAVSAPSSLETSASTSVPSPSKDLSSSSGTAPLDFEEFMQPVAQEIDQEINQQDQQ